jgi:hypothetical protein
MGMLAGILYLTQGMALSAGGLTLYPIRILLVALWLRILIRRDFGTISINRLDIAIIWLYLYTTVVFLIRSDDGQMFQIGASVDALLSYFGFRCVVRTAADVKWLLARTAILLLPYVPLLWIESTTFRNPFAVLGGVELAHAGDMWVRGDRLRATGSFGHPSLLGTLGGTLLPLYIGLLAMPGNRIVGLLGTLLCLAIVGAANSGGPVTCVAVAVVGWVLWPMREKMPWIRAGLAATIALLALLMKAPIWYLIARISSITGGDGHHRAVLLDVGVKNLDRWWFAGMPFRETSSWLPYTNTATGFVDMTNNFLQFGVNAGLGAVFLLIASLTVAFSQLGRAMHALRSSRDAISSTEEPLYWGIGVMLAVHIINWFGITYWDQTNVLWLLHLAVLGSLTHSVGADSFVKTQQDKLQQSRRD